MGKNKLVKKIFHSRVIEPSLIFSFLLLIVIEATPNRVDLDSNKEFRPVVRIQEGREEIPTAQKDRFERLFEEGKKLFREEMNPEGALKRFKEAQALAITREQKADVYFYLSLVYYATEGGEAEELAESIMKLIEVDYYRELDKRLCPPKYRELFQRIKREYGVMKVQSEPAGADVYLNDSNVPVGKTPLTIGSKAGSVKIKIKKGKIEKKETLRVIAGKETMSPIYVFKQPSKSRSALLVIGGGNYISGGDLNDGSQGLADYRSDILAIQPQGQVKPAHLSYILGGEITLALSSHFSLGIGADFFLGEKESLVEFREDPSSETFTAHPKMQAVPLRLAISYYPVPNFYAKFGIEYYLAKCAYYYRFEREVSWEEWRGEATAKDFGILGGLGLELNLSSSFSFIIEATGRYARISGFKGRDRSRDSTGTDHIEEGTLYFYRAETSGGDSYPLLFIRENIPAETSVFNPREAIIDFSGFSLKAGIKIKF